MDRSFHPLEQVIHWVVATLAFLLPLAYLPAAFDLFGAPKIFLVRMTAAALAILMIILLGAGRLRSPANRALIIATAVFLLIVVISTAFSQVPLTSLFGLRRRYFGLLTYVSEITIFLSLALVAWREEQLLWALKSTVVSATLVALVGIAQSLGSSFPFDLKEQFGGSAYSTLGNPNFTGIFLAMTLPISAYLALSARARSGKPLGAKYRAKYRSANLYFAAAFVIQLAGLVMTGSSGALVGAFLGMALYALMNLNWRRNTTKFLMPVAIIVTVAALGLGLIIIGRTESTSIGSRLRGWRASARLVAAHPLIGVGPDAMRYYLGRYLEPDRRYNQEIFEDGHNLLLTAAGTLGLPGLAAFLAIVGITARALWKGSRPGAGDENKRGQPRDPTTNGGLGQPASMLLASLVAYLAAEMVNPDDIVPLTLFWILVGMAGIFRRPETGDERPAKTTSARKGLLAANRKYLSKNWWPAAAVPAVGVALLLLYTAVANLGAEISLQQAEAETRFTPTVAAFREAQARFPYYDWYYVRLSDRLADLVKQGDDNAFQIAEAAARQAVSVGGLESNNYVALGTVYRYRAAAAGDDAAAGIAIANYRKAILLNPLNLSVMRDLAITYSEAGDQREAGQWTAKFASLASASDATRLKADVEAIGRGLGRLPPLR